MVFSGQGPQNLAMGRALFAQAPIFRDTLRLLDDQYKASTGISLIDDVGLFGNKVGSDEDLNQPQYTVGCPDLSSRQKYCPDACPHGKNYREKPA